jgi:hypothetical protein
MEICKNIFKPSSRTKHLIRRKVEIMLKEKENLSRNAQTTLRAYLTFLDGLNQQGEHKPNSKFGASPCG